MKLNWKFLSRISDLLYGLGLGISIHAIANELYYKGGYKEILSLQGEWIGFSLLILAWIVNRLLLYKEVHRCHFGVK